MQDQNPFAATRAQLQAIRADMDRLRKDGEGGTASGPDSSDVHVPGPMGSKKKPKATGKTAGERDIAINRA